MKYLLVVFMFFTFITSCSASDERLKVFGVDGQNLSKLPDCPDPWDRTKATCLHRQASGYDAGPLLVSEKDTPEQIKIGIGTVIRGEGLFMITFHLAKADQNKAVLSYLEDKFGEPQTSEDGYHSWGVKVDGVEYDVPISFRENDEQTLSGGMILIDMSFMN